MMTTTAQGSGHPANDTGRLLRLPEVRRLTSLSKSSLYRLVKAGKFPPPIQLNERASAWLETEISAWLAEKLANRAATPKAN